MSTLAQRLSQLTSAEEFLDFFGLPYEQSVLNVNRLHILQRFRQYIRREQTEEQMSDVEMFKLMHRLLARSYEDFVHSTPQQEKVFKVFHQSEQRVSLDSLRQSIRSMN